MTIKEKSIDVRAGGVERTREWGKGTEKDAGKCEGVGGWYGGLMEGGVNRPNERNLFLKLPGM